MRFRASFFVTTARGARLIFISPMALAFRIASSVRLPLFLSRVSTVLVANSPPTEDLPKTKDADSF